MTLAELDQEIAAAAGRLKLLKKIRRTMEKAEQLTIDLSKPREK